MISGMSFLYSWLCLGADWIVSAFTPDDQYVGLMVEASAGLLWRGGCDSNALVFSLRISLVRGRRIAWWL